MRVPSSSLRQALTLLAGLGALSACRESPPAGPRVLVREASVPATMTVRDTALLQLEASAAHEGDSHRVGVDRVGLRIERKQTFELCFFDPAGQPHQARLLEGQRVVATHQVGEPCAAIELAPGDYVVEVEHAQRGVEGAADEQVFVRVAPGHVSPERLSAASALAVSSDPCSDETSMPASGEIWLYYQANCQGLKRSATADVATGLMASIPSNGTVQDTYPSSIKIGPNTTALVFPKDNFDAYSPWWTASGGATGTSYASFSSPVYGSVPTAHSVRVITPPVHWLSNGDPVLPGSIQIYPQLLYSGWRVSGTISLERLQFFGPASPWSFDDVVIGPWTALYYGKDLDHARIVNDSAEPLHVGAVNGWTRIDYVWPLADPATAIFNSMIVISTRSCRFCNLEGTDLHGLKLQKVDLSNSNLASTNCDGADFSNATLDEVSFHGASLKSTEFSGASAKKANFSQAVVSQTSLKSAQLQGARFYDVGLPSGPYKRCAHSLLFVDGSDLSGAGLGGACIEAASFVNAKLVGASFSPRSTDTPARGLYVGDAWNARDDLWPSETSINWGIFTSADLDGVSFGKTQLGGATLTCTRITNASAEALTLTSPAISRPTTTDPSVCRTSFAGSTIRHDLFPYSDYRFLELAQTTLVGLPRDALVGSSFVAARMAGMNLSSLDLSSTNWSGAWLQNTQFNYSVLADAGFQDAVLYGAQLVHADLEAANFDRAKLGANPGGGARAAAASLNKSFLKNATFRAADLTKTDLSDVSLYGAGVSLDGANLTGTKLGNAYLAGVVFAGRSSAQGASLGGAQLNGACLVGADLRGADLRTDGDRTSLAGAFLQGTRLEAARLEGANLSDALVSFDGGTTTVKRLFRSSDGGIKYELATYAFEATGLSSFTSSETNCPDGRGGPCLDAGNWTTSNIPVVDDTHLDW